MFGNFRQAMRRRRDIREIRALGPRALGEIGLGRTELEYLVRTGPRVNDRMASVAALHGVSLDDLSAHRPDFLGCVARCDHCPSVAECRDALADTATRAADTAFCPNYATFRGFSARA